MRTKVTQATGLVVDIDTDKVIGFVTKFTERTPVMTRDGGYNYATGHTQRTMWRAEVRTGVGTGQRGPAWVGNFHTRTQAVAHIVKIVEAR